MPPHRAFCGRYASVESTGRVHALYQKANRIQASTNRIHAVNQYSRRVPIVLTPCANRIHAFYQSTIRISAFCQSTVRIHDLYQEIDKSTGGRPGQLSQSKATPLTPRSGLTECVHKSVL